MSQPMLRSARQALLRASRVPQSMPSLAAACFQCQQQQQQQKSWLSTRTPARPATAAVQPTSSAGGRRPYATVSDDSPEAVSRARTPRTASAVQTTISIPLVSLLRQMAAAAAPSHPAVYATVHIHGRPYLVTAGDRLRLPFRMPDVRPGDELRLDRVGVVGSRSLTAVGDVTHPETGGGGGPLGEGIRHGHSGHVPGVYVRAIVLGVESEPMRVMVKKKRRTRRKRTVRSKHQYTVLRIQEVVVGEDGPEDGQDGHEDEDR